MLIENIIQKNIDASNTMLLDDSSKIESKLTYKFQSEICRHLMISYDELINEIADYNFNFHWTTSYGAKQNRTNKQILLELSLLKPVLQRVLENIDFHFNKVKNVSIMTYENQLKEELEKLIKLIEDTSKELLEAKINYHETWLLAKKRLWTTASDLGKAKLNWKLARNNACQVILTFYEEIIKINNALQTEEMIHTLDSVIGLYNSGIKNIIMGPNYYSYLSMEDRKKLTEKNIARKRKKK